MPSTPELPTPKEVVGILLATAEDSDSNYEPARRGEVLRYVAAHWPDVVRDAERYRWLRESRSSGVMIAHIRSGVVAILGDAVADSSVDAARAQQKEQT